MDQAACVKVGLQLFSNVGIAHSFAVQPDISHVVLGNAAQFCLWLIVAGDGKDGRPWEILPDTTYAANM